MADANMIDMLIEAVVAVGALGTAAYGLADATKLFWGGLSNPGFGRVERAIHDLYPGDRSKADTCQLLSYGSVLQTLRANWLNGMPLTNQRDVAKSLIKLHMTPAIAPKLAEKTGVNPQVLATVADTIRSGGSLSPEEANEFGRFDLMITTALDAAYQRGDQIYRNACKLAATVISVFLAVAGGYALDPKNFWHFGGPFGEALLVGLLATPIAPVAKDLSTAIQAGAKAMQAVRKFGR